MSLAINGSLGTLNIISELLHLQSPLRAEITALYSQISLGSHVDNKEGPPGTGKTYVKSLSCLVIEVVKLCREDKPQCGEELTIWQSAGNAATIEAMKTFVSIVSMKAPVTCSTARLPAATQKSKTVSSPLDANSKIIKKCDTVTITHGSLDRECTKSRPAFNICSICRNIIDEKQMSCGCGDVSTAPLIDEYVRKNGGVKEKVGDSSQTAGGRETIAQRIATATANYMDAGGKGTHSGYVTAPKIVSLVELLVAKSCGKSATGVLNEATDEAIVMVQKIIEVTDYFSKEEQEYRRTRGCKNSAGKKPAECGDCEASEACKLVETEVSLLAKLAAGGLPKDSHGFH